MLQTIFMSFLISKILPNIGWRGWESGLPPESIEAIEYYVAETKRLLGAKQFDDDHEMEIFPMPPAEPPPAPSQQVFEGIPKILNGNCFSDRQVIAEQK